MWVDEKQMKEGAEAYERLRNYIGKLTQDLREDYLSMYPNDPIVDNCPTFGSIPVSACSTDCVNYDCKYNSNTQSKTERFRRPSACFGAQPYNVTVDGRIRYPTELSRFRADPPFISIKEIANRVREAHKEEPIGMLKYLFEQQKGKDDERRKP